MSKIVVNAASREIRVALLENNTTAELWIEPQQDVSLVGNIYKGRVTKILPGMQAAFVDIGLKKAGFLHVADVLTPSQRSPWPEESLSLGGGQGPDLSGVVPSAPSLPPLPAIEEILHEGQELLVQVTKEPLGTKGCRLTSCLTFAGRYLVLVPGGEHVGVSRRITAEADKERLRQGVMPLLPPGMGCIVRTLGGSATPEELQADLQFLLALWHHIQQQGATTIAPYPVHQEFNLLRRTIRDLFTEDVENFLIDDPSAYEQAVACVRSVYLPHWAERLTLYQDPIPIFEAFGIERDIERALHRKVWLKSGGYITIDHTEALVAIDVNTGRFVGADDASTTILTTNLEAVHEVVRQLRLRNLGGLIIIDFIDMEKEEHKERVFHTLEQCLKPDRARTRILQISEFGLVEMTRKRVRPSLSQLLCEPCDRCQGTGLMESATTVCSKVFRELARVMRATPQAKKILINGHPRIADMLYNEEKVHIAALEHSYRMTLVLKGDSDLAHGQFEVLAL